MNQIFTKVASALGAGCTMVLKPSEVAPLTAILCAEVLDEAGVPAGVFNLVLGDGPSVGSQPTAHKDIAVVSFMVPLAQAAKSQNRQPTPSRSCT